MRGRHKSLDSALKKHVLWLETLPGVKKIVLGFSEACRHKYSPGVIRFKQDVNGGIKVNGYSGKGVTDMFIRIDPIENREEVKARLKDRYSG